MRRVILLTLLVVGLAVFALAGCGGAGDQSGSGVATDQPLSRPKLPSPTPGSKAAAPGVPTSKHGDNSIQRWGVEATVAEQVEGTAAVQLYLDARVEGDWKRVCDLLASRSRAEQSRIVGGLPCSRSTAILLAGTSRDRLAEEAEIEALSFRIGGGYAFLIYRRPDGIYAIGLTRQGGDWKVVSATPNPLS